MYFFNARFGYEVCLFFFIALLSLACNRLKNDIAVERNVDTVVVLEDTIRPTLSPSKPLSNDLKISIKGINKTVVTPHELVGFAKTLIGIPYKYASTDPSMGFDCSGFITYVFNHFNIKVPRSSVDFTHIGKEIKLEDAKEGDLILFTGTVDSIRIVGHMGIITNNIDTLKFIHSTSGRANAVTISDFTNHYERRFVKVISIF